MRWTHRDFKAHAKPVTLGNLRSHDVRALRVYCGNPDCGRSAELNADAWRDETTVGAFQPRMRCTACDHVGADVHPAWHIDGRPLR